MGQEQPPHLRTLGLRFLKALAEPGILIAQLVDQLGPRHRPVAGVPRSCWSVGRTGRVHGRADRPTIEVDAPLSIGALAGERATPHAQPDGLTGQAQLGGGLVECDAGWSVTG